jgi:hypothetical protein
MAETMAVQKITIAQILLSIHASDADFAAKAEDPNFVELVRKAFSGWSE